MNLVSHGCYVSPYFAVYFGLIIFLGVGLLVRPIKDYDNGGP